MRCVRVLITIALLAATSRDPLGARAAEPAAKELAAGDVDPATSRVYVHVKKRRLGHEHGVEGRVKSGRLQLDAADKAGQIIFDMTSFKADTDAARQHVGLEGTTDAGEQSDVTKTMTGVGVLDVAKYPTATFTVTSSKRMEKDAEGGHARYELVGEFDLHGKKQPLTVVAVAGELKDGLRRLTGEFTIKQTDYGIKPFSTFGGIVSVADALRILGDLSIKQ